MQACSAGRGQSGFSRHLFGRAPGCNDREAEALSRQRSHQALRLSARQRRLWAQRSIKISRAPLQCPDPFCRPAQQTKLWSVPHACCPRAMHPCIQPPRASRPRAAPCDPSTLVSTCSAARCSRPVCARRRVFCVTSWGARDGLGRFRDVCLPLVLCFAAQDLEGLLAGGR